MRVPLAALPAAATPAPDPALTAVAALDFAPATFALLVAGDRAAEPLLAWETLHIAGEAVGDMYMATPDQAAFRRMFLWQFATALQDNGAALAAPDGWFVDGSDATHITVAAQLSPHSVLLLTVVGGTELRLEGIEIVDRPARMQA